MLLPARRPVRSEEANYLTDWEGIGELDILQNASRFYCAIYLLAADLDDD
jgi:hypothetical protein